MFTHYKKEKNQFGTMFYKNENINDPRNDKQKPLKLKHSRGRFSFSVYVDNLINRKLKKNYSE